MLHKCQFLSSHIALHCTSNSDSNAYERILICTDWCVCVFCLSCCISSITLHTSDMQQRLTFILLLEKSLLTTRTMKCLSAEASGSLYLSSLYRLFLPFPVWTVQYSLHNICMNKAVLTKNMQVSLFCDLHITEVGTEPITLMSEYSSQDVMLHVLVYTHSHH